jgi:hypothetical protein
MFHLLCVTEKLFFKKNYATNKSLAKVIRIGIGSYYNCWFAAKIIIKNPSEYKSEGFL